MPSVWEVLFRNLAFKLSPKNSYR
uniref:Uncharacterized protein n=1 Tax=Anguilla anguilla TaxID=7936 RepID=A0A0E9SGQ5_ANGAN